MKPNYYTGNCEYRRLVKTLLERQRATGATLQKILPTNFEFRVKFPLLFKLTWAGLSGHIGWAAYARNLNVCKITQLYTLQLNVVRIFDEINF